jgi:hypothetical protein
MRWSEVEEDTGTGAVQDGPGFRVAPFAHRARRAGRGHQGREKGFRVHHERRGGIGRAEFDERMLAELRKAATERRGDPERVTLERWTIPDLRGGRHVRS